MGPKLSYRISALLIVSILALTGCSKVSRPEGVDPIYATDFSDGTWEVGEYGTGRVGYADGQYAVTQFGGSDFMWGQAYLGQRPTGLWPQQRQHRLRRDV